MAERKAHALLREAMTERKLTQAHVARMLGCSPSNISQLLAGAFRLSDDRKIAARDFWGIPIEAWSLPADANTASQCEGPQAARISSVPPFIGTTPEACPESASAA